MTVPLSFYYGDVLLHLNEMLYHLTMMQAAAQRAGEYEMAADIAAETAALLESLGPHRRRLTMLTEREKPDDRGGDVPDGVLVPQALRSQRHPGTPEVSDLSGGFPGPSARVEGMGDA